MTHSTIGISAESVLADIAAVPSTADLVAMYQTMRSQPPRVTWIHVPFGDGIYRMMLGRKEIAELERTCGYQDKHGAQQPLGIGAIYGRMARGRAFLPTAEADWSHMHVAEVMASEIVERDCIETVRLALIGGGLAMVDGERVTVNPTRAKQLVDCYIIGQPLEAAWTYAFAVLSALITGVAPNDFGEEASVADVSTDQAAAA